MEAIGPIYFAKLRRARAPWIFELTPATLAFATIVLLSTTSLLYLTQASHVAATGYDITYAEGRRQRLEREQQMLLMKEAQLRALGKIEADATTKLGMVPAPPPDFLPQRAPPVDVEAALARAEAEAQRRATTWQERLAAALGRGPALARNEQPAPTGATH
jgi:hypothetical protein